LQCRPNVLKQHVVIKWLLEEFDRTFSQGLQSHVCISVRRNEDDRYPAVRSL
jgi:hypothetical protein